jgi:hypothetical protein
MKGINYLLIIFIFGSAVTACAKTQIDLSQIKVYDTPNDGGSSITIEISEKDYELRNGLSIFRKGEFDSAWTKITQYSKPVKRHIDDDSLANGIAYSYGVATEADAREPIVEIGTAIPEIQFFNIERLPVLIGTIICIIIFFIVTYLIKKKGPGKIRKVAGLAAVDEAIGRATEMGKPVLFTPGWGGDIQRPTTIAALNILNLVAEKTAEYNCDLIFPTHDPVIMSAAEETIQNAYTNAGHPDEFKPDNIYYTTSSQFGYAAAVDGAMTRINPATVMLLGTFEGEALILAETANSIGSMQIAGTDSTIQLAFFLVACDYTLIGEELFAASGYLSKDEKIIASIKAQDYMKIIIAILLLVGAVLATFGIDTLSEGIM